MFCGNCGKELKSKANFCGYCGWKIPVIPETSAQTATQQETVHTAEAQAPEVKQVPQESAPVSQHSGYAQTQKEYTTPAKNEYAEKAKEFASLASEKAKEFATTASKKAKEYTSVASEKTKEYATKSKEHLKTASKTLEGKKDFFASKKFIVITSSIVAGIIFVCVLCFAVIPAIKNSNSNFGADDEFAEEQDTSGIDAMDSVLLPDYVFDSITSEEYGNCTNTLYLVGFSKDSKVALIHSQYFRKGNYTDYNFFIQDMVTDEVLSSEKDRLSDFEYDGKTQKTKQSIKRFVKNNYQEIHATLTQYEIIVSDENIKRFPYRDGNLSIDVSISTQTKAENGNGVVEDTYICTAKNQAGKTKVVTQFAWVSASQDGQVKVLGYVKSPYENRLLVILLCTGRGNKYRSAELKLVGCHTKIGF